MALCRLAISNFDFTRKIEKLYLLRLIVTSESDESESEDEESFRLKKGLVSYVWSEFGDFFSLIPILDLDVFVVGEVFEEGRGAGLVGESEESSEDVDEKLP